MSWSDVVATGQGGLEFRLVIAGHPIEFVTSTRLEGSSTDGRVRLARLNRSGIKWGESLDPAKVELSQSGFTAAFTDDPDHTVGDAFIRLPVKVGYLDTSIPLPTSPTLTVIADLFSNGDNLYIGQECMNLTSKVGTTYTVDRTGSSALAATYSLGYRDSFKSAHYVDLTLGLTRPEITSSCVKFEGLTVYLFAYGDGQTGDGTLVWTGIVESEPRLRGLTTWELSIGGVTTILEQSLGAGLDSEVGARGINYSAETFPLIGLARRAGASYTSATTLNEIRLDYTTLLGHYETQQDFCDAINTAIVTQTAGWLAGWGTITAIVDDVTGGWYFRYTTGVTPYYVDIYVRGHLDYKQISKFELDPARAGFYDPTNTLALTLIAGRIYRPAIYDEGIGLSNVPRGWLGKQKFFDDDSTTPTYATLDTLYVNGSTGFAAGDNITIAWPEDPSLGLPSYSNDYRVDAFDASIRKITVTDVMGSPVRGGSRITYATIPSIKSTRLYVESGHVGNFIDDIVLNTALEAPLGRQPFVTGAHVDVGQILTVADEATAGKRWLSTRYYAGQEPVSLSEYIREECKMIGLVPSISNTGRMRLVKFGLGSTTSITTYTVTSDNYLSNNGIVSYERNAFGSINKIRLNTGYDIASGDYLGRPIEIQDATALSRSPIPRIMTIEPRSTPATSYPPGLGVIVTSSGVTERIFIDEINALAQIWFSVLGTPYEVFKIVCPLTAVESTIGSYINMSISQIPNSVDGGRGANIRPGFVVGRLVDPVQGTVELTCIASVLSISGYAPSSDIDSISLVSGIIYDIQLDNLGLPGWAMSDPWEIGDVVVIETKGISPFLFSYATITAVDRVNDIVTVNYTGGTLPTSLGSPVTLEYDIAALATTNQKKYCYIAGSDLQIGFLPTEVTARKLS